MSSSAKKRENHLDIMKSQFFILYFNTSKRPASRGLTLIYPNILTTGGHDGAISNMMGHYSLTMLNI